MTNSRFPNITAEVSTSQYPVGRRLWRVAGDGCSAEPRDVILSLSFCSLTQFSCDTGVCVDIERRCDQTEDCQDGSDEKNCRIVKLDTDKYLKDKHPTDGVGDKVSVEVDLEISRVLKIDEVGRAPGGENY